MRCAMPYCTVPFEVLAPAMARNWTSLVMDEFTAQVAAMAEPPLTLALALALTLALALAPALALTLG